LKRFSDLYLSLDSTNKANAKVAAIEGYFQSSPPQDAAWAVYFLCGGRLRSPFPSRLFRAWAAEAAGLPDWLFAECYEAVGDLAEVAALVLDDPIETAGGLGTLSQVVKGRLIPLRTMTVGEQHDAILQIWQALDLQQRLVWNKLITGSFRVGVSKAMVIRALSRASSVGEEVLAHRLMGEWSPSVEGWQQLISKDKTDTRSSQPYPVYLAYPLERELLELGELKDWQVEWKWDRIRAQVVRRGGATYIWSRSGELITDRFPEVQVLASKLPDGTVLDGELTGWKEGRVLPFGNLQQRIGRKSLSPAILAKLPVTLIAFDMLEWQAQDIRPQPLRERRSLLESLEIPLSEIVQAANWMEVAGQRERAREIGAEGLMLKRLGSSYGVGREKGNWWKWKLSPYHVDAVLIYAQRGQGRRAGLYTDYTFGIWHEGSLVPFAKAYSGLTDEELRRVDQFIRRHTIEKFGPVCTVKPELVFEIAFDAIQRSNRHRSGIAVRFPRMARWRTDKRPEEADTLESVQAILLRTPV
jgi:DNA ligase-1